MPDMIRAGLVGITGYTGMELARLLATHPCMRLNMACSRAEAGRRLRGGPCPSSRYAGHTASRLAASALSSPTAGQAAPAGAKEHAA